MYMHTVFSAEQISYKQISYIKESFSRTTISLRSAREEAAVISLV